MCVVRGVEVCGRSEVCACTHVLCVLCVRVCVLVVVCCVCVHEHVLFVCVCVVWGECVL